MTLYMLDTNVASAAMRGVAGLDMRLAQLDPAHWCISAVTRSEMRYGLALKPGAVSLARCVEAFLASTTTMPWDEVAADHHGRLRAWLRNQGTPIGDFDEMIAAHAMALDAVLVTDNMKHFTRVQTLVIENWIRPAILNLKSI
jgi:tRNA(fMet)-specific endonuclease VapC